MDKEQIGELSGISPKWKGEVRDAIRSEMWAKGRKSRNICPVVLGMHGVDS